MAPRHSTISSKHTPISTGGLETVPLACWNRGIRADEAGGEATVHDGIGPDGIDSAGIGWAEDTGRAVDGEAEGTEEREGEGERTGRREAEPGGSALPRSVEALFEGRAAGADVARGAVLLAAGFEPVVGGLPTEAGMGPGSLSQSQICIRVPFETRARVLSRHIPGLSALCSWLRGPTTHFCDLPPLQEKNAITVPF
ncbi:hypothetical protein [Streptomyces chartreusis]